jgi:hypothetical protein
MVLHLPSMQEALEKKEERKRGREGWKEGGS